MLIVGLTIVLQLLLQRALALLKTSKSPPPLSCPCYFATQDLYAMF